MCQECRLPRSSVASFSVTSGDATFEGLADDISPLSRCEHLGRVFLWALSICCKASLAPELVKLGGNGRGIGGEDAFCL